MITSTDSAFLKPSESPSQLTLRPSSRKASQTTPTNLSRSPSRPSIGWSVRDSLTTFSAAGENSNSSMPPRLLSTAHKGRSTTSSSCVTLPAMMSTYSSTTPNKGESSGRRFSCHRRPWAVMWRGSRKRSERLGPSLFSRAGTQEGPIPLRVTSSEQKC